MSLSPEAHEFATDVAAWFNKATKILKDAPGVAAVDMMRDVKVVPGINQGFLRQTGTIPFDTKALVESLVTVVDNIQGGYSEAIGERSYALAATSTGGMISFSWGGGVNGVDYATDVHYGWRHVPGTHWIPIAASTYSSHLLAAISRIGGAT